MTAWLGVAPFNVCAGIGGAWCLLRLWRDHRTDRRVR